MKRKPGEFRYDFCARRIMELQEIKEKHMKKLPKNYLEYRYMVESAKWFEDKIDHAGAFIDKYQFRAYLIIVALSSFLLDLYLSEFFVRYLIYP